MYISEIIMILRSHFVGGSASSARTLIMDCVVLVQNRHHVSGLDKGSYCENCTGQGYLHVHVHVHIQCTAYVLKG